MNPPVNWGHHGLPTARIIGWLAQYEIETYGLELATDASVYFGNNNCVQPDAALRIQNGGLSKRRADGSVTGAPELVVEVAASSAAYDLHEKKDLYLASRVPEYLLWIVYDRQVLWYQLQDDRYEPLPVERNGCIRSQMFPGLRLDSKPLLADQKMKVARTLKSGLSSVEYLEFAAKLKSQGRKKRKL